MAAPQITLLDPPFTQVEGVFNFRSVGNYITPSNPSFRVKPNLLFRSGEVSAITASGAETLSSLHINKIFDLRAKNETAKWQTASPNLANIQIVHTPIDREINYDHEFLTAFLRKFEVDELNAFLELYDNFLVDLGPALEATIRHIIDDPEHPPLIHCTVGKDRTGIIVTIILLLLGVSEKDIAADYALTEVGMKPAYEMLTARVSKVEAFRNNPIGAQNMGKSSAETMIAVIKMIHDKYGDAERYTLQNTSLRPYDVEALRKTALIST